MNINSPAAPPTSTDSGNTGMCIFSHIELDQGPILMCNFSHMAKKSPKSTTPRNPDDPLSRRERQIMDIIYAGGEVSARTVWAELPDPPSYATVRTLLRVLLEKGHVKHRVDGRTYIYSPKKSRASVAKSALERLLKTFYGGSVEQAVSGLLEVADTDLGEAELERIEKLIEQQKLNTKEKR